MIIFTAVLFTLSLALGILFATGKGTMLAKTKNDKLNAKLADAKVAKFISKLMFTVTFCSVLMGVGAVLTYTWLFQLGVIIIAVVLIYAVSTLADLRHGRN